MPQQTFAVTENARIEIRNCHNRVTVVGWDDAQTVAVDTAARQEGDTLFVENASKATLRVPRAAALTIADCEADIRVDDLTGRVELANIGGDVVLRNLRGETSARDMDGDVVAKAIAALNGTGKWQGDVVLRHVDGPVTIENINGDFVASGVRGIVEAEDVGGDAVVSLEIVAGMTLRAEGDVVINLPEQANAEIELDAPHGDLVARANIKVIEGDEQHLRGTLGNGGVKIQVESTDGDVIVRQNGSTESFVHAESFGAPFARMGQQIAAEVRQSVRQSVHQSLRDFDVPGRQGKHHRLVLKMRQHGHRHEHAAESAEPEVEEQPRGPAAGSPERKAILDAIARGELSVNDAIRKLTGEE